VNRVSALHPFHADPDPGFEKFTDPDPGLYFYQKLEFLHATKAKKEL